MKKKIAFISPSSNFFFRDSDKNRFLFNLPGFDVHRRLWSGLGTAFPILASLTDENIFDIQIIDENIEPIDFNTQYDLVAVSTMTQPAIRAYQICSEFKKKNVPVIIGGIHPTAEFEEAAQFATTVVVGEAETLWKDLLNDFLDGNLKKFYKVKDYSPVDLTTLPMPRYDLLKEKNYKIIWINTTRGCPYDCEFCAATTFFGHKIRTKSINQIIEEIKYIKKLYPRVIIGFGDDNLFVKKEFSKQLLKEFEKIKFIWIAQSDISVGENKDLLKLLYRTGCQTLFIGLESLDKTNLNQIYDKTTKLKSNYLQTYPTLIDNIQQSGIGVWGAFIIGMDNDTKETFINIENFVQKTKLLGAQLTILTPLPGTRLRERMKREHRILPLSWENYTLADVTFIHPNLTYREIENGMLNTLKNIFSNDNRLEVIKYFKNIMKKLVSEKKV